MACIADEMNSERTGRPCLGAGRRLNSTTVHESWNITCFGGHPIHTATASYGAWALYIHCSYRLGHLAIALCMARNWEYRIIITTCRYHVSCYAMAQTLLRNPMTTGGSVALRRLAWGLAGSVTVETVHLFVQYRQTVLQSGDSPILFSGSGLRLLRSDSLPLISFLSATYWY